VDDASRLAYVETLEDERGTTTAAFLQRAIAWFKHLGVRVRRVMTDNGSGYVAAVFVQACTRLRARHIRTRPYRPQTNGKAERFIQTMLRECLYAVAYRNSPQRSRALQAWLGYYNRHRSHGSLEGKSPLSRLHRAALNNVLRNHS
jgi:transposase InsO family protein